MDTYIDAIPKVELHLHLEGSLRPETMWLLADRNGVGLGVADPAELESKYQFESFDDFLKLFLTGLEVLQTGEDFLEATVALAAELGRQNVRYAEVTTTPYNHHRRGVSMADYVAGLDAGRTRAREVHGVELGWICDIPRELEPPDLEFTADFIAGSDGPAGVVALGLGGPETGFPPELFAASFARTKAAGLGAVPHAGETEGPASVWGAINELGADRIGHGIRSVEDPRLLERLAADDIPLEISLSSNVSLGVAPSVAEHPLPALLDAGVPVCLNTDDPAYFMTDLTTELGLASEAHGVDAAGHLAMQRTALRRSFAPNSLKTTVGDELAAFV